MLHKTAALQLWDLSLITTVTFKVKVKNELIKRHKTKRVRKDTEALKSKIKMILPVLGSGRNCSLLGPESDCRP